MRPSLSYAQTLLSICGCRACLGSRHKLVLGVNSTTRRSVKHGPPTTFIFSTLFTVAAAVDARVKTERRQELNEAIDDAERSLQTSRSPSQITESEYLENLKEEQEIEAVIENTPWGSIHPVLPEEDRHAFINAVLSFLDPIKPDLPQLWARTLGLHRGSLFTSDKEKAAKTEKWTPKKLRTLELSLAKLVAELSLGVLALRDDNEEKRVKQVELKSVIDVLIHRLENINDRDAWDVDDIIPPAYPRYWPNPARAWDDELELKESISAVMDKFRKTKISLAEALENISHNLLVAPQPPNSQTYSALIEFLSRAHCYDLADMALKSMLETHRRPDEQCVATIFDHFRRSGDAGQFERFRRQAKGYYGSLIGPYWQLEQGDDSPLSVARQDRPVQGLQPTGPLYSSLIAAHLKFRRYKDALKLFYQIEDTRIDVPLPVLAIMIRGLVEEKQATHAKRVFHKMLSQLDRLDLELEPLSKSDEASCREALNHAANMFRETKSYDELEKLRVFDAKFGHGFAYSLASKSKAITALSPGLESLIQQRRLLEELVEFSRTRVRELDMKALALWFIFRSGHALKAIREAYLRFGDENEYVHWAVARIASGQDVWMPANWSYTFGAYSRGRWRFKIPPREELISRYR